MNEEQRRILRKNRLKLVSEIRVSQLYDLMISYEIFTPDMIEEIKSAGTNRDQARQLITDLETRGSRAFSVFLRCLEETGQNNLAGCLREGLAFPPSVSMHLTPVDISQHKRTDKDQDKTSLLPKKEKDVNLICREECQLPYPVMSGYEHVREYLRFFEQSVLQRVRLSNMAPMKDYKMSSNPCGHCLIINNMIFQDNIKHPNRLGSNIDCNKLENLFKSFNFLVTVYTNLKKMELQKELHLLAGKDHSAFDCCIIIILSHGSETSHNQFPGGIYGTDGLALPVQQVVTYFDGSNCPTLRGKPKLFFIQACGGEQRDMGFHLTADAPVDAPDGDLLHTDAVPFSSGCERYDVVDAVASLPTPSDILVSYSTFPGYVSWRAKKTGSWYVDTLDDIFQQYAHSEDLTTLLLRVADKVSQISAKGIYKQIPGCFNFLRKRLFFKVKKNWRVAGAGPVSD
ncbi:caspase-9 [Protopterus annectens]|uniref:caspase-9 n=1 Tax=Protopterus annectens TaxID=7888 RepID=UPI001CFA2EA9|nr:caspase-9 [Protopterus annectens]